jgi:hypothetical protein
MFQGTGWGNDKFFRKIEAEYFLEDERCRVDEKTGLSKAQSVKRFIDTSAKGKIVEWKKGIREGTTDETYKEYVMMREMGWSWAELFNTPETVVLSVQRIISLKAKEELRKQEEEKQKMKIRR